MLLYESPKGESFAFRRWEYFCTILSALTCCCMLYAVCVAQSEIFTFGKFKQNKVHFFQNTFRAVEKWNFQILKILSKIKLPFASPACSGGGVSWKYLFGSGSACTRTHYEPEIITACNKPLCCSHKRFVQYRRPSSVSIISASSAGCIGVAAQSYHVRNPTHYQSFPPAERFLQGGAKIRSYIQHFV